MGQTSFCTTFETGLIGRLTLASDGEVLTGCWFEHDRNLERGVAGELVRDDALAAFAPARDWLARYFAGEKPASSGPAHRADGTEFQRAVWTELERVPYGCMTSYGALARRLGERLGRQTSARAVGGAVGRNRLCVIVPCHRVVGADGTLTGFAGGLDVTANRGRHMRARSTGKKVDAQVEVSLAEAETRGACLHSYSELVHKDLRRRLKLGQVVEPLPGLYARKEYWDGLNRGQRTMHKIRGLSRLRPGWVFCGPSAAFVLGASVSWSCLEPIEVVSSSGHRLLLGGRVHGRYANDDDAYGVYSDGIWTTSPLRTALDCARRMPFRDAVAVVDSLMVSGRFSKEEFLSYVDGLPGGFRGVARAREVASFADVRSGSGGESVARAAMWELGFAAPELQVSFCDPIDGSEYFVDFLWRLPDGRTIAGELDGGEKYVNPKMTGGKSVLEVMRDERRRESRVTASCDAVVRFSPADVADNRRFSQLLDAFGVPRDHEPLVVVKPSSGDEPLVDEVPLEAYGV